MFVLRSVRFANVQHALQARFSIAKPDHENVSCSGASAGVQWQWRYWRHGQWQQYDTNASRILEAAFANGEASVPLSVATPSASLGPLGVCDYIVSLHDPGAFTQLNVASGYSRPVRRGRASDFQQGTAGDLLAPRFEEMAASALRSGAPVMLRGGTFSLRTELQLGKGANLTIRGPGKILGDAHALFRVVGNRALLDVEDVCLEHVGSDARQQRRELGAAVFVLGLSSERLLLLLQYMTLATTSAATASATRAAATASNTTA